VIDMSDTQDAARWRYTQREGYFSCGPCSTDGDWYGYSVGIQKKGDSVNLSVQGRGASLAEALDEALCQ